MKSDRPRDPYPSVFLGGFPRLTANVSGVMTVDTAGIHFFPNAGTACLWPYRMITRAAYTPTPPAYGTDYLGCRSAGPSDWMNGYMVRGQKELHAISVLLSLPGELAAVFDLRFAFKDPRQAHAVLQQMWEAMGVKVI
jgi:hypothetical protein